jgi:hypothetical protein
MPPAALHGGHADAQLDAHSYEFWKFPHRIFEATVGTMRTEDDQEVPVQGHVYTFLVMLLRKPGKLYTYWELASEIRPDDVHSSKDDPGYKDPTVHGWSDLSLSDQADIKHALGQIVYQARGALGERIPSENGSPEPCRAERSSIINRPNRGYAIRPGYVRRVYPPHLP